MTYAGLTQDHNLENFSLILDYAQGNLQEHLKTRRFTWAEKIKLAIELTKGLYCIHSYEMFHGGLVNIFKNFINCDNLLFQINK